MDVGAKLNCLCKSIDGRVNAEVYAELSLLEKNVNDGKTSFPQNIVLKSTINTPTFAYGDHVLVGNVRGVEARHYLEVLGAGSNPKNDNVYFVLTVERL